MGKKKKVDKKVVEPKDIKEEVDQVVKEKELSELIREKITGDRKQAVAMVNEALKKFNMKLEVRHTIDIVPITK